MRIYNLRSWVIPALFLGLLLSGCGKDVVIDVNALPCGTARGNAASGSFVYSGLITSENCSQITAFETYRLLELDEITIMINHFEPGVDGCEFGRLEILFPSQSTIPEFTLKGGIWSDGSYRVGQAINVGSGNTFRVLMDGKYFSTEESMLPQDHFGGSARVDIANGEAECTFKVEFFGNRD